MMGGMDAQTGVNRWNLVKPEEEVSITKLLYCWVSVGQLAFVCLGTLSALSVTVNVPMIALVDEGIRRLNFRLYFTV